MNATIGRSPGAGHTCEGAQAIQAPIVGRDIAGVGAFA
jgi:hypothetical protein